MNRQKDEAIQSLQKHLESSQREIKSLGLLESQIKLEYA
jgi:hypothetical protein